MISIYVIVWLLSPVELYAANLNIWVDDIYVF